MKAPALPMLCLMLGGCSAFNQGDEHYKTAVSEEPLTIPTSLKPREMRTLYPIPGPLPDTAPENRGVVAPQRLVNPADGSVRLQRLGDQIWIIAELPPAQVWPRLRGFIAINQIPTRRMDVRRGVVETGWLKIGGAEQKQKFRFWIESGLRENTAEVHILQAKREVGERWPERSSDPEQARLMLDNLAHYIVELVSAPSVVSAQTQYAKAQAKMRIESDDDGYPQARLAVNYERAWVSVMLALEKSGLLLLDRDRKRGSILLAYDPKGQDRAQKLLEKQRKKAEKRAKKQGNKAQSDDPVRRQIRNINSIDPERVRELAKGLPRVELRLDRNSKNDEVLMTLRSNAEDFDQSRAQNLMRSITEFII